MEKHRQKLFDVVIRLINNPNPRDVFRGNWRLITNTLLEYPMLILEVVETLNFATISNLQTYLTKHIVSMTPGLLADLKKAFEGYYDLVITNIVYDAASISTFFYMNPEFVSIHALTRAVFDAKGDAKSMYTKLLNIHILSSLGFNNLYKLRPSQSIMSKSLFYNYLCELLGSDIQSTLTQLLLRD